MPRNALCFVVAGVLSLLAFAAPGLAKERSLEGMWLAQPPGSAGGFGQTLELYADGRIRLSWGVIVATRWKLVQQDGDRYTVQLINPSNPEERYTVELQVQKGKTNKLIQWTTDGNEKVTMKRASRHGQPDEPLFVGRWIYSVEGIKTTFEYTEDGWRKASFLRPKPSER